MATTYTVVKGDTLWKIAQTYGTTVNKLVELNHISNPNYIVVGQVIKLDGSADPVAKNTASKAIIKVFGLQSNTDRTMYATVLDTGVGTYEKIIRLNGITTQAMTCGLLEAILQ